MQSFFKSTINLKTKLYLKYHILLSWRRKYHERSAVQTWSLITDPILHKAANDLFSLICTSTLEAQLICAYVPTTVVYCSCDGMLQEDLCLQLAIGKILFT